MKDHPIYHDVTLPVHHQAAKIPQPGRLPLYPTSAAISNAGDVDRSSQCSDWPTVAAAPLRHRPSYPCAVRALAGTPSDRCGARQRLLMSASSALRRGTCRIQEGSQRNTMAIDHCHSLRAFAPRFLPTQVPLFSPAR
jgi:hypothetical protein